MSVFFTGCKRMLGDRKQNMDSYGIKKAALDTRSAVKEKREKNCYFPTIFNRDKVMLAMMHVIENIRINHSGIMFFIFIFPFVDVLSI
jgi:hypothetical protein